MPKYRVEIVETLSKFVEVNADCADDAELKVKTAYKQGEHVLDANNFSEVSFVAERKYSGTPETKLVMYDFMVDQNGNTVKKGDRVKLIVAGEFMSNAVFLWATEHLATIREENGRQRTMGKHCAFQALKKYVYKTM